MSEENKNVSKSKKIDYSSLPDDKLLEIYEELKKRQLLLYKRIMSYNDKYNFLPEVNSNDN